MDGQVIGNLIISGSGTAALIASGLSVWRLNRRQRPRLQLDSLGCIPPPDAPYEAPLYFPLRLRNTGDTVVTIDSFYLDLGRSLNVRFKHSHHPPRHHAFRCRHSVPRERIGRPSISADTAGIQSARIYALTLPPNSPAAANTTFKDMPLALAPGAPCMTITVCCPLRYAQRNDGTLHQTLLERIRSGRFSLLASTTNGEGVRLQGAQVTLS